METLLKKDRINELNPYLFQKIQTRINGGNNYVLPLWGINVLKYSFAVLGLLICFNIYTFVSNKEESVINISQVSYDKFVEENHLDALDNLYPEELLSIEE